MWLGVKREGVLEEGDCEFLDMVEGIAGAEGKEDKIRAWEVMLAVRCNVKFVC